MDKLPKVWQCLETGLEYGKQYRHNYNMGMIESKEHIYMLDNPSNMLCGYFALGCAKIGAIVLADFYNSSSIFSTITVEWCNEYCPNLYKDIIWQEYKHISPIYAPVHICLIWHSSSKTIPEILYLMKELNV